VLQTSGTFFILYVQWLLRQQDGQPFRAVVQANPSRIMNLATGPNKVRNAGCASLLY